MSDKNISDYYADAADFHNEALKYFNPKPIEKSELNDFFAYCFTHGIYNALKYDTIAGYFERTMAKLFQEIAFDFIFIHKKMDIWNEVQQKFENLFLPVEIVSQKLTLGETKETTQALPFLGLMKTGGWGELTKEIHRGQFSEGVFKPNIESSRRNEQRNQQIARIITAMLECEVFFVAYIEKYRAKYTWRLVSSPTKRELRTIPTTSTNSPPSLNKKNEIENLLDDWGNKAENFLEKVKNILEKE